MLIDEAGKAFIAAIENNNKFIENAKKQQLEAQANYTSSFSNAQLANQQNYNSEGMLGASGLDGGLGAQGVGGISYDPNAAIGIDPNKLYNPIMGGWQFIPQPLGNESINLHEKLIELEKLKKELQELKEEKAKKPVIDTEIIEIPKGRKFKEV